MTDDRSPFERPAVSQGYPLDRQERMLLEQVLHRVHEEAPSQAPLPVERRPEGDRGEP